MTFQEKKNSGQSTDTCHPTATPNRIPSKWIRYEIDSLYHIYARMENDFCRFFSLPAQLKRDANYFVCASETERNKNLN